MLLLMVTNINDPERLNPIMDSLGKSHREYGALPEQVDVMGIALDQTVDELTNFETPPEVRRSLNKQYGVLAEMMKASMLKQKGD